MVSEICSRQKIFKFCKLGTQLAYATLKIQHTHTFLVLAPPTYQVSSRQSIWFPKNALDKIMDGVWRIDICIAMSLPELSSGEQKLLLVP